MEDSPGRARRLPQERATDTSWKAQAACQAAEPERFEAPASGEVTQYGYRQYRETARQFCSTCPVREMCKEEADRMQYEGLFGGDLRVFDEDGVPRMVRFTHRGGGGIRWVELAKASR